MLRHKMFKGLLVAVVCLFLSIPATAKAALVNLTVDGGWHEFGFFGVDTPWNHEFSFNLLTPGILTVTDAFFVGDSFEVFSNGMSLGTTSDPTPFSQTGEIDYETSYDLAAANPLWSTGVWNLAAGNYLISGLAVTSPLGAGGGALRVDTAPVPAPAAIWLLGSYRRFGPTQIPQKLNTSMFHPSLSAGWMDNFSYLPLTFLVCSA